MEGTVLENAIIKTREKVKTGFLSTWLDSHPHPHFLLNWIKWP